MATYSTLLTLASLFLLLAAATSQPRSRLKCVWLCLRWGIDTSERVLSTLLFFFVLLPYLCLVPISWCEFSSRILDGWLTDWNRNWAHFICRIAAKAVESWRRATLSARRRRSFVYAIVFVLRCCQASRILEAGEGVCTVCSFRLLRSFIVFHFFFLFYPNW